MADISDVASYRTPAEKAKVTSGSLELKLSEAFSQR